MVAFATPLQAMLNADVVMPEPTPSTGTPTGSGSHGISSTFASPETSVTFCAAGETYPSAALKVTR